jgi:uroporphyrin-III C-methyltransferase
MANLNPRLTLVGAGPGDPDLITVKGLKALQSADVILYDALIDKDLLKNAPQARKIFVGKRKGFKIYSQEAINEMIVDEAYAHGHVVRLKGGDPFIFGRGAEEIAHARQFGVQCEIVPGISSANAVPVSIGISVTLRHVAQSYMVLTGTTSAREFNNDIAIAAQTSATLVILMGIGQMEKIVGVYAALGQEKTPIAIIQNGYCKNQKQVVGEMHNILDLMKKEDIGNPAVIVIGEVVKHAQQLQQVLTDENLLQIA